MEAADGLQEEMTACRRDLHRYPEPGWTEFRTAAKAAAFLTSLGYTVKTGADVVKQDCMMGVPSPEQLAAEQQRAVQEGADPQWVHRMDGGRTGLVAEWKFREGGPVVAIRFDMDCNEVTETDDPAHKPNQESFASHHPGAMHACGHDGHTTVGLALARVLASLQEELRGTVRLIFQPAEEGVRGAYAMVESGIVDDVDYLLGAHFGFKMRRTGSVACNVTGFWRPANTMPGSLAFRLMRELHRNRGKCPAGGGLCGAESSCDRPPFRRCVPYQCRPSGGRKRTECHRG